MEGSGWRPASGGGQVEPSASGGTVADGGGDWRNSLPPEARQRIVSKIMETLKRHLPISVPEGLSELKKIAIRFEEKIYTAATSQSDYLRKISLKMLSMETKTQNPGMNPSGSGVATGNQNPADPASLGQQSQVNNPGQSLTIPSVTQSPARPPLLGQNLPNNAASAAVQGSSGLTSALPSVSGLSQSTIANVGQTSNLQNMSGVPQNSVNSSAGLGAASNIYANAQRMQGRQQQSTLISQQHQQQAQNPLLYQHQLQQQLLNPKISHPPLMQTHLQPQQQQQQSLLQPNQLQSSHPPLMQMTPSLQSGQSNIQQAHPTMMQSGSQSNLQQNQQNSVQQSIPSLLQQHPQSVARQQQPQSSIHQQSTSLQQPPTSITQSMSQQQQQLLVQQSSMSNMQQTQVHGQQNSSSDMQQQQHRLPIQQNNLMSMQQSQQMLNQQPVSLHQQQQLGSQGNVSGLQQQQQSLQQQQQSLQQQQQQQMLGSQSNVSNMQSHQLSMHLLQQPKAITQQQTQQSSLAMLQGQQSQHQSSQQQMMSQMQSQTPQMQQQLAMHQQPNSLSRDVQQRLQTSSALLQSQNAVEPQKQFIRLPESSSTSMDSTAQTVDWQEDIYQKIKTMKDMYFAELNDLNQRLALKIQQQETMGPPRKQPEQFEKLKQFKSMLERSLLFLQMPKNSIPPSLKDKLSQHQKQIMGFVASNRSKKNIPTQSQGQPQFPHSGGHSHLMSQQQSSQVSQLQPHDNHANQAQQIGMQGSLTSVQSTAASNMQHGSMPLSTHFSVPATQQNMTNVLQPSSNLDQGGSFNSLQQTLGSMPQGGVGSLQNTISASQQATTPSQSSVNGLQPNISAMQPGSNMLQHQHLKQQQQEQQQQQLLQTQQLKQQLQHRHIQQLMQQQQKQQLLQQQMPMQQQLHQQQKQQQMTQLPVHQMTQLNQMNDVNELKMRQSSTMKPGLYQYPTGQRHNYYHQQLKSESSIPISSPQNIQASSPQISQHSSPQLNQHSLLSTNPKVGTPLQSTSSPFVAPSPSTPIAPSPIPGDSEKHSGISSLPNAVNVGHQQAALPTSQAQSLAVTTPGISASPLLAEFTSSDGSQVNAVSTIFSGKAAATERPFERLIKAVRSLSPQKLSSSICDIGSVVSLTDRLAGSAPDKGSKAAVGEDLVAMTKCRLQARSFMSQDGNTTKKMKRNTTAMPLNIMSSAGSGNNSFKQMCDLETSELESTATSSFKRQKSEVSHALLEEIREVNLQLIDTVVNVSEEDTDSHAAVAGGEGTVVKCAFSAVSLSANLKSQFASTQMSPIKPLRLLVPPNYPKCSPIVLDKLPSEMSKELEDLSVKAQSRFSVSLRSLSQPMSLREMARTWDACARKVIEEYAQQTGGGSFSSRFGAWENCVSA